MVGCNSLQRVYNLDLMIKFEEMLTESKIEGAS